MHTIRVKGWRRKAGHHEGGGRTALHHLGELAKDLGQAVAVPDRAETVHRRADQEGHVRTSEAGLTQLGQEALKDGLNDQGEG